MKLWAVLIILCASSGYSYWENQTRGVQAPRISVVDSKGQERTFARVDAGTPVSFDMRSRTSAKWVIFSNTAGTVSIHRTFEGKDTALVTKHIIKGTNALSHFCEPGIYVFVSSVPIRVHFFVWRNLNLTPLVPVGGGFPVSLQGKDNSRVDYYYVSSDTVALLRVAGPATAYVYVRAFVPVVKNQTNLEIEIQKEQQVVSHKLIESVASPEAAYVKPEVGFVPGKAALVKFRVPRGIHEYTVRTINDRALVRFCSKREVATPPSRSKTPVLGKKTTPKPPTVQVAAATAPVPEAPAKPAEPPIEPAVPQNLSISARTGLLFSSNAFLYGEDKHEGFPPDSATSYRYPYVKSLSDFITPLDMWARWRISSFQLRGSIGATAHKWNKRLNNLDYSLAMAWLGPGTIEFAYTYLPTQAVRPTYTGTPGLYSMLSYTYHRAQVSMNVDHRWHPAIVFSYGVYKYNTPFDYLNAVFFGGDFGVERNRVFGVLNENMFHWDASLGLGEVLAVKETERDRSNSYAQVKTGSRIDLRSWSFGLQGRLRPRFYSTVSDSDSNKGRRDLEYGLSPVVQYSLGSMTAALHFFETNGRRVWAADPGDETSKSYTNLSGGLQFTFNIRPLEWVPTERG